MAGVGVERLGVVVETDSRSAQSRSSGSAGLGGRWIAHLGSLVLLGRRRRKKSLRFCLWDVFPLRGFLGCCSYARLGGEVCGGVMKSCENRLTIFSVVAFPEGLENVEREMRSMVNDCKREV